MTPRIPSTGARPRSGGQGAGAHRHAVRRRQRRLAVPVPFDPEALAPWTGFAAFGAEVLVLLVIGWVVVQRRDA